jgi:excisionase family DNA binding protein
MIRHDRKNIENSYYSTRELAKLFRVNHTTIRRWADSGKLKCFKSPGGHRKFTPEHIGEFISEYHYQVLSPRFEFSSEPQKERLLSLISSRGLQTLSEVFFAETYRAEIDNSVEILMNCYDADIPLVEIYDIIIRKAVQKILRLQKDGKLSESDKHVCHSSMVESLNQFRLFTERAAPNGKIAICASLANGLQEVALLCISHLLRVKGWKVYNLGANTPLEVLSSAAEEHDPTLICLPEEYLREKKLWNGRSNLETIAESRNALLLYFNFYTKELDVPEGNLSDGSMKTASSYKELLSYAANCLRNPTTQERNLGAAANKRSAVETIDAPNE